MLLATASTSFAQNTDKKKSPVTKPKATPDASGGFTPLSELNKKVKPGEPKVVGLNPDGSLKYDKGFPLTMLLASKDNFKVTRWVMPNGEQWACAEYNDPSNPDLYRSSWAKLKLTPDLDYGNISTTTDGTNGFLVLVPKQRLNKSEDVGGSPLSVATVGEVIFSGNEYQIRRVSGTGLSQNGKDLKYQVSFYMTKSYRAFLKDKQSGLNPKLPTDGGQFADDRSLFLEESKSQ